ncbi:hypothetical protein [Porphyromonas gingivalis]|uniref:hypothetical protein n=1 Tax=Porphyromonas gingivalis TaxID=837 RepID=UPI0012FD7BAC|nr:hypothetical protein [Porphyromonas gingivalis]
MQKQSQEDTVITCKVLPINLLQENKDIIGDNTEIMPAVDSSSQVEKKEVSKRIGIKL